MKELDKEQLLEVDRVLRLTGKYMYYRDILKEKGLIKEQFEVGEYYRLNDDNDVIVRRIEGDMGSRISKGKDILMTNTSLWTKMTPKEVEEALIKEAKKRGYRGDSNIEHHNDYEVINDFFYDEETNCLYIGVRCASNKEIFSNGIWTEIIPQEKKEEVIERIESANEYVIINKLNEIIDYMNAQNK